tara:strand:- start:202 stop:432 length:231 start_codon:yes stop_codon:yes gene_type:complete
MAIPEPSDVEFAKIVARNFPEEHVYEEEYLTDNQDGHLLDYQTFNVVSLAYIPGFGRIDIVFVPDENPMLGGFSFE